jgi:hypothetical protein
MPIDGHHQSFDAVSERPAEHHRCHLSRDLMRRIAIRDMVAVNIPEMRRPAIARKALT